MEPGSQPRVISIRNLDVVLDRAVAEAFRVETRAINQAVARNPAKFGAAHVFQLTPDEVESLTSQAVISKSGRGGSRALPWVFTMKGVARLATVIDTQEALQATVSALDHLKERMKTRGLENDKLAAETLLILEQVRDLRERRQEQLRRARAHTEGVILNNLDKKISLVERALQMLGTLEPSALVSLYADLSSPSMTKALLPPPKRVSAHTR